ncbi:SWR1-complex protein 4-like, partial [Cajanus cajan]|uniref:SWR1-complex protein 4-like n=1 Tax=Cajanus cajan TaxID=3821 RepID=UPI0010FAF5BD
MDAKDVLGLPKNSFPPLEKKSRPPKESQRKPDGISREVYALTSGLAPLMPAIEASQLKKKPLPLEKVCFFFCLSLGSGFLSLVLLVKIIFTSIIGYELSMVFLLQGTTLLLSIISLLAVVQSVDVIKYTDEEYDKYLTDPVGIMSNCTILWNFLNGLLKLS